ncbi:unnamed protein product, partial [Cladocopium goreaui]
PPPVEKPKPEKPVSEAPSASIVQNEEDRKLALELAAKQADLLSEEMLIREAEEEAAKEREIEEAAKAAAALAQKQRLQAATTGGNPFSTGGRMFQPGVFLCDERSGYKPMMGGMPYMPPTDWLPPGMSLPAGFQASQPQFRQLHPAALWGQEFARMAMKAPPYMPSTYAADPPQRQPVPIPPRDFRSERSHERHGQWEGSNGYDYGEWGDWQKGAGGEKGWPQGGKGGGWGGGYGKFGGGYGPDYNYQQGTRPALLESSTACGSLEGRLPCHAVPAILLCKGIRLSEKHFQAAEEVCRDWAAVNDGKDFATTSGDGRGSDGHLSLGGGVSDAMPFLLRDTPHLCVLWKPPGWTVSVSHSSMAEAHAADVPGVQGGRAPRLQDGHHSWLLSNIFPWNYSEIPTDGVKPLSRSIFFS